MYPPIRMSILDPCPQLQVLCNILPAIYCCCARNDALYWYCAMCCRCAWHVLLIDVHDMCYWLMCKTSVIDWHAWHVLLMDVHDVLLTDVQDMCYWLVTCVTVVTSVTYLIHEKNNNKKNNNTCFLQPCFLHSHGICLGLHKQQSFLHVLFTPNNSCANTTEP